MAPHPPTVQIHYLLERSHTGPALVLMPQRLPGATSVVVAADTASTPEPSTQSKPPLAYLLQTPPDPDMWTVSR